MKIVNTTFGQNNTKKESANNVEMFAENCLECSSQLTTSGIAFHHLVGWLEAGISYFRNRQLFMVSLLRANNRSIGGQREVDPGVGHQVGLELGQVHVEGSVKPQ